MMRLELQDIDDEEFQSAYEACGDCDPFALVLDGQVIGLVNVRYDDAVRAKLRELGVEVSA